MDQLLTGPLIYRQPSVIRWGLLARVNAAAVPFPYIDRNGIARAYPAMISK